MPSEAERSPSDEERGPENRSDEIQDSESEGGYVVCEGNGTGNAKSTPRSTPQLSKSRRGARIAGRECDCRFRRTSARRLHEPAPGCQVRRAMAFSSKASHCKRLRFAAQLGEAPKVPARADAKRGCGGTRSGPHHPRGVRAASSAHRLHAVHGPQPVAARAGERAHVDLRSSDSELGAKAACGDVARHEAGPAWATRPRSTNVPVPRHRASRPAHRAGPVRSPQCCR